MLVWRTLLLRAVFHNLSAYRILQNNVLFCQQAFQAFYRIDQSSWVEALPYRYGWGTVFCLHCHRNPHWYNLVFKFQWWFNPIRPGGRGGGSETGMTILTAVSQKPLTLWCPDFVTFSFYDMFWPNFSKIVHSGGLLLFSLRDVPKNLQNDKILLYLEIAEIDTGDQFWVQKNDSGHKNSFFWS